MQNTWDSFLHGPPCLDPTSPGFWPSNMDSNGGNAYANSNSNSNFDDNGAVPMTTVNAAAYQNNTAAPSHQQEQSQQQQQAGQHPPPLSTNLGFLHGLLGFDVNGQGSQGL